MIHSVLIIKTGHAETLEESRPNKITSLGDVFRSTFLLNYFKSKQVEWVTHSSALIFIKGLPQINQVYTERTIQNINWSKYHLILNLEKDELFIEKLSQAKTFMGFYFKEGSELFFRTHNKSIAWDSLTKDECYQKTLCSLLGYKWNNEPYLLGYRPLNSVENKVGINWNVGKKWPEKNLNQSFWQDLSNNLKESSIRVSWQEGFEDLKKYIDWLNTCHTIITLDSLGLHLAMTLRKNVIALFGPTNLKQIYPYKGAIFIKGDGNHYLPESKLIEEIIKELNKITQKM